MNLAHKPQFIAFRTDASVQIGTGHVMRCLTLADSLRKQGAECTFICRPHTGHLLDLIAQRGHNAVALPNLPADATCTNGDTDYADWLGTDWSTDAADTRKSLGNTNMNWLVVDHYALDSRWEQALRDDCQKLMVIDDLANRAHDCDLLLDQNLGRTSEDYDGLTRSNTIRLIGPKYALLRPEFTKLRPESLARRAQPQLKRLLITMGGVDKDNATSQVLDALRACPLPEGLEITVIMGPHAPWLEQVKNQARQMPCMTQVLAGVSNMAQLMTDSDLAIGAAGSTSWERCCLGLPTIQLVLASNQKEAAAALSSTNAVESIESTDLLSIKLKNIFLNLDANFLRKKTKHSSIICDGRGAKIITELLTKTPTRLETI